MENISFASAFHDPSCKDCKQSNSMQTRALLNLSKKYCKIFLRAKQLPVKGLIGNRCHALEAVPKRRTIHKLNAYFFLQKIKSACKYFDMSTNVRGGTLMWARMSGWSFDVSTNVRGGHLMWARMSGPVKNRVGTNVRGNECPYTVLQIILEKHELCKYAKISHHIHNNNSWFKSKYRLKPTYVYCFA